MKEKSATVPINLYGPEGEFLETWECPVTLYRQITRAARRRGITFQEYAIMALEEGMNKIIRLGLIAWKGGKA